MQEKAIIMDENAMKRAIARISYEIIERNKGVQNLCIIGIMSKGVYIAEMIATKLSELENTEIQTGTLDITSYRDDEKYTKNSDLTRIDFDIKGKNIILVDDVIYTGRTTRAAIDAIMDRGRPKTIQLAVLVDRGHRELPFRADYVGKNLPTSKEELVKVFVKKIDGSDRVVICEQED